MGKTESYSGGLAMLSKYLIKFSAHGWGCAPFLLVVWPEHPVLESAGSMVGLVAQMVKNLPAVPETQV